MIFLLSFVSSNLHSQRYDQECVKRFVDACFDRWPEEDQIEVIAPNSSWVKYLVRFKREIVYNTIILINNDNSYYLFSIDKETWESWKSAPSKGTFYNEYIRGVAKYKHKFLEEFCTWP